MIFQPVPRFTLSFWNIAVFQQKIPTKIFNFSWGIKKLGHPIFFTMFAIYIIYIDIIVFN
ncbi:hypothetical protein SAMN05192574_102990 [Mucilaginibacter gossypiicola]|uniref:Uncharacterized protein n=1 Tax=Mucilaginibacter gossypiicola TaxID=551995 RepID=A0A1H8F8T6_9SPHI|nr:hypothetical protein SAMN05192574_102990 [Mucilaginibacter gossypiicola]